MSAITTDHYLNNILPKQPFVNHLPDKLVKMQLWIHEHPTTIKIAKWLGMLGGFMAIASLPVTIPAIGFGVIPLVLGGLLVGAIATVAYMVLDILAPPSHDMRHHVFKEGECNGTRLYYSGDVPILEIKEDATAHEAGYAHGFLLGEEIQFLRKSYHFDYNFVVKMLHQPPTATQLPHVLAEIKKTLTPEHLEELNGLVEGFNAWIKTCWFKPEPATLDEILLFHLAPDSTHFNPENVQRKLLAAKPDLSVACTAIVNKDQKGETIFVRNMDWPSLGVFGTYTLITNRKHKQPGLRSTYEVGLPGFIGTLTGMNDRGLSLSMNVCSKNKNSHAIQGMPAAFYNRYCLEHCDNVDAVDAYVSANRSLGAYHLTAADKGKAASFHMDQSETSGQHFLKRMLEKDPLIVTNCTFTDEGGMIQRGVHMHSSEEREEILEKFFLDAREKIPAQNLDMQKLMEHSLSLPYVNNWLTTHRVAMLPAQGVMKVSFNNAYAGNIPMQTIRTTQP